VAGFGQGADRFLREGAQGRFGSVAVEATATLCGVRILNEAVEEHVRVPLGDDRLGLYLHVDDTLVLGVGECAKVVAPLMEEIADNMEAEGFRVPDRRSGVFSAKEEGSAAEGSVHRTGQCTMHLR